MADELAQLIEGLHELGYGTIDRTEGYETEASGYVSLPEEHRRESPPGWRRFVPRVYCNAGTSDLLPDDLRATVEAHGWTAQAMGRDDERVTVVVSENGV